MKIIILFALTFLLFITSAHSMLADEPISRESALLSGSQNILDIRNQAPIISIGEQLITSHSADPNSVNTTIIGEQAGLIIRSGGSVHIDANSGLLLSGGQVNIPANTIDLQGLVSSVESNGSVNQLQSNSGTILLGSSVSVNSSSSVMLITAPLVLESIDSEVIDLSERLSDIMLTGDVVINNNLQSGGALSVSANAIPVPPALWLFGSAIATLLMWLRKSKSEHKSAVAV